MQDLPAAVRRNNQVVLESDIEEHNGRLYIATIRPIRRAGDRFNEVQILSRMADTLRSLVRRRLQQDNPGLTAAQLNQVRGSLMMYNRFNEGHTYQNNTSLGN